MLFHRFSSFVKQIIWILLFNITRKTLRPTYRIWTHKQTARGPGDAPSNNLPSPQIGPASLYQIVFMASSIVQTMDWRNWYANRQLKPDFIYFKISHRLTQLFSKVGDWPRWNTGPMHLSHQHQLVLWRGEGEACSVSIVRKRGLKSSRKVVLLLRKPFMRQ